MKQLMHQPLLALLFLALLTCDASARDRVSPEVAVVAGMYRDFAWEVIIGEPISVPYFIDQPASVLGKYLDRELVRLILADRACAEKSGEICNLDFAPMWASQDPAVTDLMVRPGKKASEVAVSFRNACNSEPIRLRFEMTQTPSGPRIRDIHYAEGSSLLDVLKGVP